jgi:hypothetical protein
LNSQQREGSAISLDAFDASPAVAVTEDRARSGPISSVIDSYLNSSQSSVAILVGRLAALEWAAKNNRPQIVIEAWTLLAETDAIIVRKHVFEHAARMISL